MKREQWRIDAEQKWIAERQAENARLKAGRHRQKQRRRQKQHDGKEKLTKAKAFSEMHRIAYETEHWMSAYECEFCGFWHVGNIGKRIEVDRVKAEGHKEPKERQEKKPPMTNNLGDLFGDKLKELFSNENN